MSFIPSCRETSALLSQARDRPLTFRERIGLYVHLPLCEGCRNFRKQLDIMSSAIRRHLERGGA